MRSASSPRAVNMIRQLRPVADPAAEREPVGAGQHQVENDETGPLALQELARGVPVSGLERRVTLTAQVLDDHMADRRLSVDDQDSLHSPILRRSPYKT